MVIYKATNKINGKSYIGQTTFSLESRKKNHLYAALAERDTVYFHSALRKYGVYSFNWTTIAEGECTTETLDLIEIHFILLYDTYNNGYNSTLGGTGVHKLEKDKKQPGSNYIRYYHTDIPKIIAKNRYKNRYKRKLNEARGGKDSHWPFSVIVEDKYFGSVREAAKFLNIPIDVIKQKINSKRYPNYNYASDMILFKGPQQPSPSRHYVIRGGKRIYI